MNPLIGSITDKRTRAGRSYPLGATIERYGVNFALYSQTAEDVFLLLFTDPSEDPTDIIRLDVSDKYIWHVFIEGVQAGQLYGYVIKGPYDPANGLRHNENCLLMDPYALALTGKYTNSDGLFDGFVRGNSDADLKKGSQCNYRLAPKSIVVDNDRFDWHGDRPLEIPFGELVIYETHVKGFTAHPSSGVSAPGTYLGFIERIPYLQELGVNAIELLPVQEFYHEDILLNKGLKNYWGYNTIGFFAPEWSYSTGRYAGCQVDEFKTLVREAHIAGMEILLDLALNHTGEGNELGPTIHFKGIDNLTYYLLKGTEDEPYRYYHNFSGCGNSLNINHPQVIRLMMDVMRYWVEVMHVDGFRLDLSALFGREADAHHRWISFFDIIMQDPVLSRIKLIAQPWYRSSHPEIDFPLDWGEWNGRFRDTIRQFNAGWPGLIRDLSWRITGSSDFYRCDGHTPFYSVNYITCHEGMTMTDLVSYERKHNEANLENNQDGIPFDFSQNFGCEGESFNPEILSLRKKAIKNYFTQLILSFGIPMILGGDEWMRTQHGNNNAYCQDNEISWYNWEYLQVYRDIHDFVRKLIALRFRLQLFLTRNILPGKDISGNFVPDLAWFNYELEAVNWSEPDQFLLCGLLDNSRQPNEYPLLFRIINSAPYLQAVKIPEFYAKKWYRKIDTSLPPGADFMDESQEVVLDPQELYLVNPLSTVILVGR